MNDDIVTRLRVLLSKCCIAPAMGVWSRDLREAADEIERLRRNTGCARNQRSTQFCAEALDAQRDVETLKAELVRNADEFANTLTELRQRVETLTAERDEARREIDNKDMEIAKLRMELTLVSIRNTKLVIELDELKRKAALADRIRQQFDEECG